MPDLDVSSQAILGMLRASTLPTFVGGIVDDSGRPVDPPMQAAPHQTRVAPHAVVYFFAGLAVPAALGGLLYLSGDAFQVTYVGASPRDALNAAQTGRTALVGQAPAGVDHTGVIYETAAGAMLRDDTITPNRWTVPIVYGVTRG